MATPNGAVITAASPDGATVDLTEGVQCLYDLVINSMDWGSGFISAEEALPVAEVARACGFAQVEEVEKYVRVAAGDECPRCESTDKAVRNEIHFSKLVDGELVKVGEPCTSLWHPVCESQHQALALKQAGFSVATQGISPPSG